MSNVQVATKSPQFLATLKELSFVLAVRQSCASQQVDEQSLQKVKLIKYELLI
jgi:hypothetical protein